MLSTSEMRKVGQPRQQQAPRKALHIARTREDILMGASRAFMRSGFGAVSMADIAREVGFTAPALYAYFDSKEAIFTELLRTIWRELLETFATTPQAGRAFRDNVATLLRRQLEWTDRRRDVFLTFMSLRMRGEPMGWAKQKACDVFTPEAYVQRLAEWLERAAPDRRELGSHPAADAACALMGITHAFFIRWIHKADAGQRLADQTDRIVDFFFHGLSGRPESVRHRQSTNAGRPALGRRSIRNTESGDASDA
jgi:AcrR family transcriptional regulator